MNNLFAAVLVFFIIYVLYSFTCKMKTDPKINMTIAPQVIEKLTQVEKTTKHNDELSNYTDDFASYAQEINNHEQNNHEQNNHEQNNHEQNNHEQKKGNVSKCNVKTCGLGAKDLHPILDPVFNMREAAKQCLLLEDHINNKKKRCIDCIKKHFLMIDGLLEEAVSLEKDNIKRDKYRDLYSQWINIQKKYVANSKELYNMDEISKLIRVFRKPLMNEHFDIVSDYN
jgi:hypothetical protein